MLGYRGPAQPSPTLGDALNAGYLYLEVGALAATRTRPWPSTSCGNPRRNGHRRCWRRLSAAQEPGIAGWIDPSQ